MLIPYTHENTESRRWPVLTSVLVALNVLCFALEIVAYSGHARAARQAEQELVLYWNAHPDLPNPPELDEIGLERGSRTGRPPPPSDGPIDAEAQAELGRRATHLVEVVKEDPLRGWGYVPSENNLLGLVTYQFLHGGVLHLVFNLWFMWLCACNLEDRWGRVVFLSMYLSAGIAAALAHRLAMPESTIPLIGASGSIAGAMGAFLVLFARTKIRFFYWYFIRVGTFSAPAWVMLPLWLGQELLFGVLSGGSDGTAHFAHVGGFVYGMAFAGVMVVSGQDRRLDATEEARVTTTQDERILSAGRMIDEGRHAEAITTLEGYIVAEPRSIDAALELLRAATGARDERRMGNAYARLVDLHLRADSLEAAADLHAEAEQLNLTAAIGVATRARLAARLVKANEPDRALRVYARMFTAGVTDDLAAHTALAYASLLVVRRRDREAERVLAMITAASLPGFERQLAELRQQLQRGQVEL
jgi:membrane associated rhomboid family serine protease